MTRNESLMLGGTGSRGNGSEQVAALMRKREETVGRNKRKQHSRGRHRGGGSGQLANHTLYSSQTPYSVTVPGTHSNHDETNSQIFLPHSVSRSTTSS